MGLRVDLVNAARTTFPPAFSIAPLLDLILDSPSTRPNHTQRVKDLAVAAKKARRRCELAEWDWRRDPGVDTLAAARAAQEVRSTAEAELREACLNDEDLIAALTRQVGR
jgi:hypothetical protein